MISPEIAAFCWLVGVQRQLDGHQTKILRLRSRVLRIRTAAELMGASGLRAAERCNVRRLTRPDVVRLRQRLRAVRDFRFYPALREFVAKNKKDHTQLRTCLHDRQTRQTSRLPYRTAASPAGKNPAQDNFARSEILSVTTPDRGRRTTATLASVGPNRQCSERDQAGRWQAKA